MGPDATLDLQPGPGLTVVTGRNGSGKSSFAEAAELVLTGDSSRWSEKQNNKALWTQGWRNLHAVGPTEIEVELVAADQSGPTTVRMSWDDGQELGEDTWTVQRHQEKREPMGRGWLPDLTLYRPFLSYGELGALVDKRPTELHDALHSLLGLGVLDDARDRLEGGSNSPRRPRQGVEGVEAGPARRAGDRRRRAGPARRRSCCGRPSPISTRSATWSSATTPTPRRSATCARWWRSQCPARTRWRRRATGFVRQQVASLPRARRTRPRPTRVVALLQAALDHHTVHGDEPCPVCRTGALDAAWRERDHHGDRAVAG